jgi:adenylate kinase
VHLNPGTLLRQIAAADSDATGQEVRDVMAKGALVPDEVTDELVHERLVAIPPEQGVVLDGYPRNAAQVEALRPSARGHRAPATATARSAAGRTWGRGYDALLAGRSPA